MNKAKLYGVGDTVTITSEMEAYAASLETYIVTHDDGPRLDGPYGLREAKQKAATLNEAFPEFNFVVRLFTGGYYTIPRRPTSTEG